MVNAAVPSGYTVAFGADTVTNANKTALSFALTYPKANKTLNYSISSSGGGTPITGTIPTLAGTTTVSGINATTLPDGILTLSAYLSDTVGGTGATVTDTIPMAVLDASLIGHWTFDAGDISGTTAYDRSGQGNNGTLTNGPTQITGQVGGALTFDGADDFVDIVSYTQTWVAFSISTWNVFTSTVYDTIVGTNLFRFTQVSNVRLETVSNGGSTSSPSLTPLNQWHHSVLTFDGSSVRLYENGALTMGPIVRTTSFNITGLRIGSDGLSMIGSLDPLHGKADDVRIYNRALTPTEVTTLYNAR